MSSDKNPLTDHERDLIIKAERGRELRPGEWRNFCEKCGVILTVHAEWLRTKTDLRCDDCAPAPQQGGPMSGAFSPDRKQSR